MPDGWVGCAIKVAIPSCTTAGVAHVIAYTSERGAWMLLQNLLCYCRINGLDLEYYDMIINNM